jgi:hypothetical protein
MNIECKISHKVLTNSGKPNISFHCTHCKSEQPIVSFLYSTLLKKNHRTHIEEACEELLSYINTGNAEDIRILSGKKSKISKHLCNCIEATLMAFGERVKWFIKNRKATI